MKTAIQEENYDQIKVLQTELQDFMMNLSKNTDVSQPKDSSEDTVIDTNSKEA